MVQLLKIVVNVHQVGDHDTTCAVVCDAEVGVVEFSFEECVVVVAFSGNASEKLLLVQNVSGIWTEP